jgi:hypothetical protein
VRSYEDWLWFGCVKMLHETGKLWPALGLVEKLDDAADIPNGVVRPGTLGFIQPGGFQLTLMLVTCCVHKHNGQKAIVIIPGI